MMEPSLKHGWLGGMTRSWVKNLGGGEDSTPLCCLPQNTFGWRQMPYIQNKRFRNWWLV